MAAQIIRPSLGVHNVVTAQLLIIYDMNLMIGQEHLYNECGNECYSGGFLCLKV